MDSERLGGPVGYEGNRRVTRAASIPKKENGAARRLKGDTPPRFGCCTATRGCRIATNENAWLSLRTAFRVLRFLFKGRVDGKAERRMAGWEPAHGFRQPIIQETLSPIFMES